MQSAECMLSGVYVAAPPALEYFALLSPLSPQSAAIKYHTRLTIEQTSRRSDAEGKNGHHLLS